MNAYDDLTVQNAAELARMDRQFACWTAPLLPLALARSPFTKHLIVDVGAGLGAAVPHLAEYRADLEFIAIDAASDRIPVLAERMTAYGIYGHVIVDDAEKLTSLPDNSVTVLLLSFCLTHVNSVHAVMSAVERVLRSGGIAIVSDVDYANARGDDDPPLKKLLTCIRDHLAHADLIRLDEIARANGLSPVAEEQIAHQQEFRGREIARLALNFVQNFRDLAAHEWLAAISSRARLRWQRIQRLYRKPALNDGWMACAGGYDHG